MAQKQGTPLWITCGCGCLVLLALAAGAILGAGFFGVSAVKDYVETLKDPAARTEKAAEILGAARLPEGYSAQLFFRFPWLVDLVMLSESEPIPITEDFEDLDLDTADLGEHVFLYLSVRKKGMDDEDVARMLRGDSTSEGMKVDVDIEVESSEELGRGTFESGGRRHRYVAHRGELFVDRRAVDGVYSQVVVECPRDSRTRFAVWFRRDPEGLDDPESADLAGSPADESALRAFMGHFDVCPG